MTSPTATANTPDEREKAARHYARMNRELGIAGDLAAIKHGTICGLLAVALLWLIMNGPELAKAVLA
jgi:hypothetical protein